MSTGYRLPPNEHAGFAVISRLIACLVTESLLCAFYIETPKSSAMPYSGILVILATTTSVISEQPNITRALRPDDIFAIVPLHHAPVFKASPSTPTKHGRPVGLVDPLDMLPEVYVLVDTSGDPARDELSETLLSSLTPPPWELGQSISLRKCTDPIELWDKFVKDMLLPDSLSTAISDELRSSMYWQRLSYENPPQIASLTSAPIEWEQSLVAGHPTHPMYRARMCVSAPNDYDWYRPKIHFTRVPSESLDIRGSFATVTRQLVTQAARQSGTSIPEDVPGTIFMPVHEMQLPTIREKFGDVEILEPTIDALAQSSIRTVVVPSMNNMALKLSVNMKISSALRTISHWTADFGPRFSHDIVPKLKVNPRIFSVEPEPASAVYAGVDNATRKHFTAIFREEYQPKEGESIAVVAALLESGHHGAPAGVSAVEHVFGLNTESKRQQFLDNYIRLACDALLPPTLHNGVVFEAHAQNCQLRFNTTTGELLGFVVRDLGGLRIHPPTMNASLGTNFEFLPGHCVVTQTLEETYPKLYHTFVHNHLQRLIRLLGLHYNGVGWEILRNHLRRTVPRDHGLWKAWMETETVAGKCLLRMRLQSVHDKMVFSPIPNMLQFGGDTAANNSLEVIANLEEAAVKPTIKPRYWPWPLSQLFEKWL
ncbi:C2 domain-containing protein [Mycena indigotica]|uniref:C2 domain-containing protein n=1 Tax=Mycena indigotica TaxID=2126181 RepID=A0A8H6T790_9AGAR|nr:C2 domain-containing protein [Mycena indigotica]KAF7312079.1 C2 domain-containing protein [Mycena indigotica]